MRPLNQHLYAFGPFRLDTRERMLLREGEYVPLTPKALETLMVLVERGGRIVEKEELLRQVWPDTFVEDVTVAKNVSTLRKTLGESEQHRYIETIPKRGYRFVAELRVLDAEEAPGVTNPGGKDLGLTLPEQGQPGSPERRAARRVGRAGWLAASLLVLAAVALALWISTSVRRSGSAVLSGKTIPLTSFAGHQNQVAFSPSGNQIAFVQDSSQDDSLHIQVKSIGSETLLATDPWRFGRFQAGMVARWPDDFIPARIAHRSCLVRDSGAGRSGAQDYGRFPLFRPGKRQQSVLRP